MGAMSAVPLICPRCGAPLPVAAADSTFVTCGFCEATLRVGAADVEPAAPRTAPLTDVWGERRARFLDVLKVSLASQPPYDALCAAARAELGPLGQTDGLARITLALAADFDGENGTSTRTDPMALSRIAEAYHLACGRLAEAHETTLNLPFLTATAAGPVHLQRTVTAATLAQLAARPPAGPGGRPPAASTPKKRGWWPFG
jgi:hypothetical protein